MQISNQSIHPRVVNGRTVFPKVNTSRKPSPGTKARTIAALEAHVERHPRDSMTAQRLASLTDSAR